MEEDSGTVDEEAFCKRYFICRTRDCKQEYDLDHSSSDLQILSIFHWSTRAYGVTMNINKRKEEKREREEFLSLFWGWPGGFVTVFGVAGWI